MKGVRPVSILDLAAQKSPMHYRGILTVNLDYVLHKDGDPVLVGENEFKTAQTGFTKFPSRNEVFTLLWHSRLDDPFSWIGDECLECRSTQVQQDAAGNDMIEAIKNGYATFTVINDEDRRSYSKIVEGLAARVTLLENAGHKVTIDVSGRIKFKNKGIIVLGHPGSIVRIYSPENKSFIHKLRSNEDAYRILNDSRNA